MPTTNLEWRIKGKSLSLKTRLPAKGFPDVLTIVLTSSSIDRVNDTLNPWLRYRPITFSFPSPHPWSSLLLSLYLQFPLFFHPLPFPIPYPFQSLTLSYLLPLALCFPPFSPISLAYYLVNTWSWIFIMMIMLCL